MRKWYSALLIVSLPVILATLSIKMRRHPDGVKRLRDWLGYSSSTTHEGVWIHAASVGEVRAAVPLIQALRQTYSNIPITITTQSATGFATAQNLLGKQVDCQYCPLDLMGATKRFLARTKPRLVIIFETEIWPNLLYQLKLNNIPVLLANARLSTRSTQAYRKWHKLFKPAIASLTHIFAQTEQDALNFLRLGAVRHSLSIAGNLKYDCNLEPSAKEEGQALREKIGKDRPVWIAASTHSFEESSILSVFAILKQHIPNALLILVPRHPERFEPLAKTLQSLEYRTHNFSHGIDTFDTQDILFCDVMGKLTMLYHASDVAFIGGSLTQGQGHNPLEAATAECAIVTGTHVSSFAEVCDHLLQGKGLIQVTNSGDLARVTLELLQQPERRTHMAEAALACVQQHQGALEKHMAFIQNCI